MNFVSLLKTSFTFFKANFRILLNLQVLEILAIFGFVLLATPIIYFGITLVSLNPLYILLAILGGTVLVLTALLIIGIFELSKIKVVNDILNKKSINIKQAIGFSTQNIFSYIWINVLNTFIILFGLLLFIIPGIIFLIWFVFAEYVFVNKGLKGMEALKESKRVVKGKWWKVFGFFLGIMALSILVALPFDAASSLLSVYGFENYAAIPSVISTVVSFVLAPLWLCFIIMFFFEISKGKTKK